MRYAHAGGGGPGIFQQALDRLGRDFLPRVAKPLAGEFGSVSVPNGFRGFTPRKTDGGIEQLLNGSDKFLPLVKNREGQEFPILMREGHSEKNTSKSKHLTCLSGHSSVTH